MLSALSRVGVSGLAVCGAAGLYSHDVRVVDLPANSLLGGKEEGAYKDCFEITVVHRFEHAPLTERFCSAFFRSPVFKVERALLSLFGFASSDPHVRSLKWQPGDRVVEGLLEVDQRHHNQVLTTWRGGTIQQLLQVVPLTGDSAVLRFGDVATMPQTVMSPALNTLHSVYAKVLLKAASKQFVSDSVSER